MLSLKLPKNNFKIDVSSILLIKCIFLHICVLKHYNSINKTCLQYFFYEVGYYFSCIVVACSYNKEDPHNI